MSTKSGNALESRLASNFISLRSLRDSSQADIALRRFSVERWGRDVAQSYLEDVRNAARRLGKDPRFAKPLKDQYRIFRVRSHYLIVHVDRKADRLTVARVLHVAMDIERHLP